MGGGELKAGSSIHSTGKAATKVHKQPQFTCQADTVTSSSFIPSVALLVRPSGTAHSILSELS